MARREANFIEFPGTGMFMMCTKSTTSAGLYLYPYLDAMSIKGLVEQGEYNLYWIDTGAAVCRVLAARKGEKVNCATLITPALVKKYIKE